MVYDVSAHEQLWCTQPGHTETIFDCSFAPGTNSQLLATCSYDGTVRIWSVATNWCVKTLDTKAPGRDDVVQVKGEIQLASLHALPLVQGPGKADVTHCLLEELACMLPICLPSRLAA